jgi:CBS domain-containing protein
VARGHADRPVELAVRSVEIFEQDGRRLRTIRVFCPRRYASVSASNCTTCPFARAVSEATITCMPPSLPLGFAWAPDKPLVRGPESLALRTPVGAVCAVHAVAVRVDVPVAQARTLLERVAVVVVLSADDHVHGVLSAAEPPEGLMDLREMENRADMLTESAPLIEAIDRMLHGRVRCVVVTGDDRDFVGIVADLDVLRWVAHRRRIVP